MNRTMVINADSAFASVITATAILNRGHHFRGLVKTAQILTQDFR